MIETRMCNDGLGDCLWVVRVLSPVHTCHKMAPLNGTILWRHKIAPFFEAINLLLQNLWRHKLPLFCLKFCRFSLIALNKQKHLPRRVKIKCDILYEVTKSAILILFSFIF